MTQRLKKRLQVRDGCRIDIIYEMTDDSFSGQYKGHNINIHRESYEYSFYITVHGPNGMACYDGWWDHYGDETITNAVEEALKGSLLLK